MFVAILNARYRDVQYLVGIILAVTFFLVPIVYTLDIVPDRAYGMPVRRIIDFNPMSQFIGIARDAVYYLQVPSLRRVAAAFAWSAAVFCVGWVYFRHRSMEISEEP